MHTKAIFPGTFDPLTLGHQDLIARAAGVFDEVIVAIAMSPGKRPLFSLDERIALARQSCAPYAQVRVEGFSGLLIDFARQQGAKQGGQDLRRRSAYRGCRRQRLGVRRAGGS